ncbi:hypothetical protein CYLTODRAFT_415572 [Cylindrobasidium torrendii FP15055 ss-10]|uniref:Uncharacterized protein n=1 Tax=Cylindrobasidium torrendii FP15055 ss-10 TaxID=1314674 RepID=A0A0D7ASR4_9AGAR|nr:hypothetical protein CYLTODRAFT_415572 [Cylindrobasidium torrendii FP15055 ss-10]
MYGTKEVLLALVNASKDRRMERFSVTRMGMQDCTKETGAECPEMYTPFKYRFHHLSGAEYPAETNNSAMSRIRGFDRAREQDVDGNGSHDILTAISTMKPQKTHSTGERRARAI